MPKAGFLACVSFILLRTCITVSTLGNTRVCRSQCCGAALYHCHFFIFTNELRAVICSCVGVRFLSDWLHFNSSSYVKTIQAEVDDCVLFDLPVKPKRVQGTDMYVFVLSPSCETLSGRVCKSSYLK